MKTTDDRSGKKYGRIKGWSIGTKLCCVLFAFIIWIYVMEVDSPDYEADFNDVAISFIGTSALETDYNLAVFSGYDTTVDITVSGQKSVIGKYTSEDITVTADVSGISQSGNYTVDLFYDLPSGLSLADTSATTLTLYVDKRATATVQVKAKLSSVTIPDNCELGELVCDTDSVTVTGPQSILSEIDYALVSLDAGSVTSSVNMVGQLQAINKTGDVITNPYLKLSKTEVKVSVPVNTEKEVALDVNFKYGYFNKNNSVVTISPETVKVKGDPNELSALTSVPITTIDEKTIFDNASRTVNIELPDNIALAEGEPAMASLSIKRVGTAKKVFSVTTLKLKNSDSLSCTVLTTSLSVTLVGDEKTVSSLTADNISATADMSGYAESAAGIIYAPAEITISGNDGTVYELGEYNLQVKIS